MYVPPEIIVLFFLISFLVYTMPTVLVHFSRTLKGKILLLALIIVITLYNHTGGLLMAMFFIFLSEFNYEMNNGIMYEGFTGAATSGAAAGGAASSGAAAGGAATSGASKKKDQLSIDELLKPKDSAI